MAEFLGQLLERKAAHRMGGTDFISILIADVTVSKAVCSGSEQTYAAKECESEKELRYGSKGRGLFGGQCTSRKYDRETKHNPNYRSHGGPPVSS